MEGRRRVKWKQGLGLGLLAVALIWISSLTVGAAGADAAVHSTLSAAVTCSALAGLEGDPGGVHEAGMFVFDQASGDCLEGNSSCAVGRPKV